MATDRELALAAALRQLQSDEECWCPPRPQAKRRGHSHSIACRVVREIMREPHPTKAGAHE